MRADHGTNDTIAPVSSELAAGGQISTADALFLLPIFIAGLYLDQFVELPVQVAGSVAVWGVMLWYLHRARSDLRIIILACLAWSTFGEAFASLVWGLYRYRLYNIPMFVPPGHVLMLLLALYLAERVPRLVLGTAPVIALAYAVYALGMHVDMFSVILAPIFVLSLIIARKRSVYAATFLLVIPLELYGTWLGNWRWQGTAPWIDISMANPPLCIGALYCARDAISGFTLGWVRSWQQRNSAQGSIAQPGALSARGGAV